MKKKILKRDHVRRYNSLHEPMTASHMAKSQPAEKPIHSVNRQLSVTVENRGPNFMKGTS